LKTIALKILILGGTHFLGPHLVQEIQQRGHEATLFNRGNQDPSRIQGVKHLQGDRDGDLEALKGHYWDGVIDTSGHVPRIVEASSRLLFDLTDHYVFISTIGVYADFHRMGISEEYPLAQLQNPDEEEITEETYGALKGACERVVEQYFQNRSLIIRPGLIVGPLDPTDRFTYWPVRIKEGGDILAPGNPDENVQFIDVRDLSKWIIDMVERRATGVYNATGQPISFKQLLEECQEQTQSDSFLHWVSEEFLLEHQVQDWVELPLWLSSRRGMPGFLSVGIEKALSEGLTFRPLSKTIEAVLKWDAQRQKDKRQAGMSREKEQYLLSLWKNKI
jgi:2'-hydroxyisoflavone reductase